MAWYIVALLCVASLVSADITGQEPPHGSCICLSTTSVNVRSSPCGGVIGQSSSPQCFTGTGQSQVCTLSGTSYDYFSVQYGSQEGWMAGNFLVIGEASLCHGGGGDGNCANVEVVSRSEWNARPPAGTISRLPSKPVGMSFVHHSVGAYCHNKNDCMQQVRNIQSYAMDGNGYSDIGYNFLVGEDGRAYEGRGWDTVGAHTLNYNSNAIAICVMGDFTGRAPNANAQQAVRDAFDCAVNLGVLSSNYEMFGHRDGGCTACPGDSFYPVIQTWTHYSFRAISGGC